MHAHCHLPPLPFPGRLRLDVHGGIPDLRPSSQGTFIPTNLYLHRRGPPVRLAWLEADFNTLGGGKTDYLK
jgi:hypothetical protein